MIRLARPEDVAGIERLIDASVRGLSAGDYDARQIESALRHMFGVDTQLVADGTYFVATEGDRFVGCGGWSRRRTLFGADRFKSPGVDDRLDPAREPARIRAFFVHPDRARRGIGRRIIALCEEAARRAGFTRAELMATRPGEPLYAAMGYAVLERVDVALPDGLVLPCARMARDLGP